MEQSISPSKSRFVWTSRITKTFLDTLERIERPILFDLGPINGDNISFFGALGGKVYAYDFLREYQEASENTTIRFQDEKEEEEFGLTPWEGVLDGLDFAPKLLHGILLWDILDRLTKARAEELVNRLITALEPGGLVLSFFSGGKLGEVRTHGKYNILDDNHIEHIPIPSSGLSERYYQNGEITSIFSGLSVMNFYTMKNGYREILLQRPARSRP
jgi:hypothetical protein